MKRVLFLALILHCYIISSAYDFSKVDKALTALKDGKVSESVEQIKNAAAVNDMVAQFYLAQCYEYGIGIGKDSDNAFKMYRRVAERGFAPAMKELSRCYKYGIGVDVNEIKSDEWLSRYVKRNDTLEIENIAVIYSNLSVNSNLYANSQNSSKDESNKIEQNLQENESNINAFYENKKTESQPVQFSLGVSKTIELPKSDVDIDIPIVKNQTPDLFALIIANENYQDVAEVPNALNDGETIAKYCKLTLGIPETNIHLVKNATLNNLKREINLMQKIADVYEGQASFLIYYAGHGFPDEKTKGAYIMPVDGYSSDLTTCYSLSDFYNMIGEMPSKKTVVILDACFSGASRDGDMLVSARGVVLMPKPSTPSGNTVVLSSASGDETAYPYKEQGHGLFTYFLLEKLKESKGNIDLSSLFEYVRSNVTKKSLVINGKSQTPNVLVSKTLGDEWKNWKLNSR